MLENPAGLNPITDCVIGSGVKVHRAFGPGLLESVYQPCFVLELRANGLHVEVGRRIKLIYRGVKVSSGYKVDLIVEGSVLVEIKAVETLLPVHSAQVITYLKLTGCPVGLLINFNVPVLKAGVRRLYHPDRMKKSTT
jgi:GxxExxY protein